MKREIILAIETAIGGGSISLLENNSEIDFWISENESLRAENLLEIIAKLLLKNNMQKSDINKIIYSEGPGSHTGIRIGAATAQGLQTALGCQCIGLTILKALTLKIDIEGLVQTAIQTSQNRVWRQTFEKTADKFINVKTPAELVLNELFELEVNTFQASILIETNEGFLTDKNIVRVQSNSNIAQLLGLSANYKFIL